MGATDSCRAGIAHCSVMTGSVMTHHQGLMSWQGLMYGHASNGRRISCGGVTRHAEVAEHDVDLEVARA